MCLRVHGVDFTQNEDTIQFKPILYICVYLINLCTIAQLLVIFINNKPNNVMQCIFNYFRLA